MATPSQICTLDDELFNTIAGSGLTVIDPEAISEHPLIPVVVI